MRKLCGRDVALAATVVVALMAGPVTAAPAAGGTEVHPSATAGVLTPAPPVQLQGPPAARRIDKGARRIPRNPSALAPRTAAPQAPAPAPVANAAAGTVLANFDGVGSRDSAVTNFGVQFEPPDQALCAGNGFVMEMVNSAYTIYRPDGSVVTGPFNVNGPFDEGLIEFTSDPRCYFDRATNTWIAVILFITSDFTTASHIDVAVNTSGDPTTVWTNYQIDTTGVGGATGPRHPGCPCFGDQPRLGIDGINVYLTTEEFSLAGTEFNGDQIYAISKDDLVRQVPAPHFVHFDDLRIGGAVAGFIQPAITTGTPRAEFFLSSLDPTVTFDQRIGVWAMTNRAAVAAGNKPTLSSMVVQSEAYGIPPAAEQKGTSSTLDSGDDRMQQVQFINGSVWGELGTALTIPNDPEQRAAAAWFEVRPTTGGGVLTGATIKRQGYVAMPGNHVLYPALQTTPAGRTAMVVSVSGPNRFPSAGYAVLGPKAKEFGPVKIAAPGSTFYDPDAGRWGDYSWAVLGPNPKTVWMATEYMPPPRSQTVNRQRNWGTRVVHLLP